MGAILDLLESATLLNDDELNYDVLCTLSYMAFNIANKPTLLKFSVD